MNNKNGDLLRNLVRNLEKNLGLIAQVNRQDLCCGITFLQCHIITEIGKAEGISLNELSNVLNVDKGALSRTIKTLEGKGFVYKKEGKTDRRYISIMLTERGKAKFEVIQSDMQKYFCEILDRIPENKQQQVFEGLMLLNEAISKGCKAKHCNKK